MAVGISISKVESLMEYGIAFPGIHHNQKILFMPLELLEILTARLMELYNHTRMWIHKGHTPDELFQEEKRYLKPLSAESFRMGQTDPNFQIRESSPSCMLKLWTRY